ncbi:hypothetical protein [Sphingomonas sp. SUN039]|uniref:hypothetical protein n=1 Tax=Sphingomonas sp. SUN039 TaxID=2937787 RepID=UPI0021648938|nr:hypothetical protein [Sphingomonas sp. SUN039]UVO53048.1 hypothetical protein M0209_02535 [Sphingomonas sp. SUN039]
MVIITSLFVAACLYAGICGGAPERLTAVALVAAALATFIFGSGAYTGGQIRWAIFAIDATLLLALVLIALRANRIWPLWMSALQLITVAAHVLNMISSNRNPWAYVASITVTSFLMPPVLVYGTYSLQRRRRVQGPQTSWSSFLRRQGFPKRKQ